MSIQPSDEILERFGVRLVVPLGGRLNLHWLVEAQRERLVLRRWAQPADSVDYELRLLARVAALGWPVAPAVAGPIELAGYIWSLSALLPGEPVADKYSVAEQRGRGRLLAELHASLAQLGDVGQRGAWRRAEATLADSALDQLLINYQHERPEEIRILRWHLERARERAAGLALHDRPGTIVHGDFTQWNLLFQNGRLSGILDFELAHWDHRVADFALAWRGKYDDVIHGYAEVSPLDPEEWHMLTPVWWANLIDCACYDMRNGTRDDGWTIKQLLRRSALMGPDAMEFR
jgi:aminoglycoside phosphotransferase (APT) family kinase protein